MSVQEIEKAIVELPSREVTTLLSWLSEHHARLWEEQIADDLDAGRLDALLAEVDNDRTYAVDLVGFSGSYCV